MNETPLTADGKDEQTAWERRQSIYWDGLPFRPDRADLLSLDEENPGEAAQILRGLLTENRLDRSIWISGARASQWRHWQLDNRHAAVNRGYRPFSVGFPLFVQLQEEELVVAPMFLWELDIEPDALRADYWRIRHETHFRTFFNPWLARHFFQRSGGTSIPSWEMWQEIYDPGADLTESLRKLSLQVGAWYDATRPLVGPCPELEQMDAVAPQGQIIGSGVLGLFPPPEPFWPGKEPERLLKGQPVGLKGHAFGLGTLDPHQAEAYNFIRRHDCTAVVGPSGSGKTHLLTHLVTNALSNGQPCLVVSSSVGALRKIQSRLSGLGLEGLSLLVTDPSRDGEALEKIGRDQFRQASRRSAFDDKSYQQLLGKWEREKKQLDEAYRALRRETLGSLPWQELVGHFLQANRKEGKELLTTQLHIQDFKFNGEEFAELERAVQTGRPLFERIGTLRQPLSNLAPDIFLNQEKADARAFVHEQVELFSHKFGRLHHRYLQKGNDYADALMRRYEEWYDQLAGQERELSHVIESNLKKYGSDFELTSMTSLSLYGAILSKYQRMLEVKRQVFADYEALRALHAVEAHFDFEFAPAKEGRDLPRMRESLKKFRETLQAWRERLPDLIHQEVNRLSSKTALPALNFHGHLLELEENLGLLIASLNHMGLYAEPFENRMLTLPKQRRYLENMLERLENTRRALAGFDSFYDWQRFWLQLSEGGRKLLHAIVKVKPDDWIAAFKSWYYHQCLIKFYDPALPAGAFTLRQYVYIHQQLEQLTRAQIRQRWTQKRLQTMKALRRKQKKDFQLSFGRPRKKVEANSRRAPWEWIDPEQLLELMPVWLVTPWTAEFLFKEPGEKKYFPYVLVEEARQNTLNQMYPALRLGRHRVLFGVENYDQLGPSQSLLDQAREVGTPLLPLARIHDWHAGLLSQGISGDKIADSGMAAFSAECLEADGRYDQQRQVNEKEVEEVIRLLKELPTDPDHPQPEVAVVTLTVGQRNLIASQLRKIITRKLPGAKKIQALEQGGLDVFHLQELQGVRPDVILLSTTFAPTDDLSPLTEHIEVLNQRDAIQCLELLLSRSLGQLFFLTSVSRSDMEKLAEDSGKAGTFILANYFIYLYSWLKSDAKIQEKVLRRLHSVFQKPIPESDHSTFLEEVSLGLSPFISSARLHQNVSQGHLKLPLKVDAKASETPPLLILPDGFFARTGNTDYLWEFQQWMKYQDQGFGIIPTWSVNWWKQASKEARALAGAIQAVDSGKST